MKYPYAMLSHVGKLSESFKNLLLIIIATALGLTLLEIGLHASGVTFDRGEPPVWLRAWVDPALPPMPTKRDPISDVVLPAVDSSDVEIPPNASEVTVPPGKPPPPTASAWRQPPFYRFDPTVGVTHNPRVEGWWMVEGVSYVAINNEGFRDRDHVVAKAPDVFRIAVLGDSFAEAFQVLQDRAFWAVLERRLQSCASLSGRRVEVLNFGVGGFGTTQELLTYQKFARKYRPDVALLLFYGGNDLRDNSRSLTAAGPPVGMLRPFYRVSGDALILDNSFLKMWTSWGKSHWLERFRIVQLTRMVASWFSYRSLRNVDARALMSPPDLEYEDAWKITEKVLTRLNTEVAADGARLLVATASTNLQVAPDIERRAREARENSIQDLFYADKRLYRHSREANFRLIPLALAMSQVAERTEVDFHFKTAASRVSHWNQHGHAIAGQILAKEICTMPVDR